MHTRYEIIPPLPTERALTNLYPHGSLKPKPELDLFASAQTEVGQLTYQRLGQFIQRPYVLMGVGVLGFVMAGLCLLTIGALFTGPGKSHGQSVAMLSMAPEPAAFADLETDEVIDLIDKTQQSIGNATDESLAGKSAGIKVPKDSDNEPLAMLGTQPEIQPVPVASGRPDPFAPLVKEVAPGEEETAQEVEKDILADVIYSGFIKDVNSARNTAILKVAGTSVIKKAGDAFYVDGTKVIIKDVSKQQISLKVNGESRTLPISVTYETASASSMVSTNSSASGSGAGSSGSKDRGAPDAETSATGTTKKNSILKLEEM